MLKRIVIVLLLWIVGLHAAELVTKSNVLGEGKTIRFYPKQGESFAVTKDLKRFAPDANYDIVMRNGREIYFANRNEHEDIYIVFNEPLAKGDVVVLKVNRGSFTYTTRRIRQLPKTVKKILQAAKERSHTRSKKVEKRGEVLITTDAFCFDDQGEIVECSSPRATINQKKPVTMAAAKSAATSEMKNQTQRPRGDGASIPAPEKSEKGEKREGKNLFISFAEKIKAALSKIRTTLSKVESEQKDQSVKREKRVSTPKSAESPKKPDKQKAPLKRPEREAVAQKTVDAQVSSAEIARYAHAKSARKEMTQNVALPRFQTPSVLEEHRGRRFPAERITAAVAGPEIKSSQKMPAAQLPETGGVTAPTLYHKPESAKVQRISPLDRFDSGFQPPKYQKSPQATLPSQPLKVAAPVVASKITVPVTRVEEAPLPRRGIPKVASKPQIHRAAEAAKNTTVPKVTSPVTLPAPAVQTPPAASFAEVNRLEQQEAVSTPATAPVMQQAETTVPETTEVTKPQITEEETPKDKIVITKLIEKKRPATAAEPMVPMRERVLGGGYSADQHVGKVAVSAYANHKPISAWVEVYRGKRRVKTFYSGAKKQVTLPEGTYLLKATYRTGTSKQKKSMGKIKLKSGESIHKKVYFSIGTLNVKVTRKGKPIYAKVEIFPQGSNRRYAYTFTSRSSGIARLKLSAGRYRIVVKAHGDNRVLDDVRVKGSRIKTIPVEF